MKKTIEELWNGNITPFQDCGETDPQIQKLITVIERNRTDLEGELCNHQLEMLKKYIDCTDEYCFLISAQAFSDGFSLASRLLAEALTL